MFTETRARLGWRTGASRLAMKEQIERLQSFDPADRAHAGTALASSGLGRSAEPLLDHVANEFDDRVLSAIARAVTDQPAEPKESRRVEELRAWATEALERIALQDAFLGEDPAPARGGETAPDETGAYETGAYETGAYETGAWEPDEDEPAASEHAAPAGVVEQSPERIEVSWPEVAEPEPDAEPVEALEAEIVDAGIAAGSEVVDTDAVSARVAAALEQALAATVFAPPIESALEGPGEESVADALPARPYINWRPPGEAEPSPPVPDTGYRYEPPPEYPVGTVIEAPAEEHAAPEPVDAFEPTEQPAAPEPVDAFAPAEEPPAPEVDAFEPADEPAAPDPAHESEPADAPAPPRTLAERLKARSF